MTAVFIGHGTCYGLDREKLRAVVECCIKSGVNVFLSGGMGQFDLAGTYTVHDLKIHYPSIRNTLVIPYLTFKVGNQDVFDEIVYPEGFERYHFKAAIGKRNQYMVEQAQIAICYVKNGFGGAVQTLQYAKKRGVYTINLADL